jgi:hypothetical protein
MDCFLFPPEGNNPVFGPDFYQEERIRKKKLPRESCKTLFFLE